jgi:hypothetical protein
LEVRVEADFAKVKTDSLIRTGFNLWTAGAKLQIYKGKGIIPITAVMANLTFPFSNNESFKPLSPKPSVYLLMQNNITEKLGINYNFGVDFINGYSVPVEFAAICFEYGFTESLTISLESYNWFATGQLPINFIDVEGAYMFGKNIQPDLSISMSLQDFRHYFMVSGGFSWRIPKK